MFATDASNYRQVPIGVVWPKSVDDVIATVEICRAFDAPLLNRGGGTSLAGQCCNVAVVVDWTRHLHQVVELDPSAGSPAVRPGLVLDRPARARRAAPPDLRPRSGDPQPLHVRRHDRQQLLRRPLGDGRRAPRTTSSELEIVTYDGERMRVGGDLGRGARAHRRRRRPAAARSTRGLPRCATATPRRSGRRFPDIPRRVSGYNLARAAARERLRRRQALVGSEGTLATILEATRAAGRLAALPLAAGDRLR